MRTQSRIMSVNRREKGTAMSAIGESSGSGEVMIACNTLCTEIEHVMEQRGVERPVVWLESKLHNVPSNLKDALQQAVDEVEGAHTVLLGFGNCGNVVQGIVSRDFQLIVPRLDDCVSLVFGSQRRRERYSQEHHALYFTDGWMDKGHNILDEYASVCERYGEEDANDVFDMMYTHYNTMAFLDTGLYDVQELMERTRSIAELIETDQRVEQATLAYVERLVCGPWTDDLFVRVGPNEAIPPAPFMQPGSVL